MGFQSCWAFTFLQFYSFDDILFPFCTDRLIYVRKVSILMLYFILLDLKDKIITVHLD